LARRSAAGIRPAAPTWFHPRGASLVIVIIGILLAIAVPSYLGFRTRANRSAATADVRAAITSAEAYFSECDTYADATCDGVVRTFDMDAVTGLPTYDPGIELDHVLADVTGANAGAHYCLDKLVGGQPAHVIRPAINPAAPAGVTQLELKGEVVSGSLCAAVGTTPGSAIWAVL